MGISKRPPVCTFCGALAVRTAIVMNDEGPGAYPYRLCPEHYAILDQAGERGRVEKRSGRRWWLAVHHRVV